MHFIICYLLTFSAFQYGVYVRYGTPENADAITIDRNMFYFILASNLPTIKFLKNGL